MKYFKIVLLVFLFPTHQTTAQHFIPGNYFYPAFEKGKYGYINNTGQWIIKPAFESCDYFYEGKAIAKEKDKYGFIDLKGEWITKPKYDSVKHFSEGFAAVATYNEDRHLIWDFIDTTGNHLDIKVPALSSLANFHTGMSIGTEDGFLGCHFFNTKGEIAFEA